MSLDNADFKILVELDRDPRITTSRLGKKVRVSQQVTDYRIKRLMSEKVINQFATIIDLAKIGYVQYCILLQLGNVSEEEKQKILSFLKKDKSVYWATSIGGKWDLFIAVCVKNYSDFEEFLHVLFTSFPKFVKDYDAIAVLTQEFYAHKYLSKSFQNNFSQNKSEKISENVSKNIFEKIFLNTGDVGNIALTALDFQILSLIKSDCRMSSLELGKQCKVSYKTIQQHIKNLEVQKIIQGYRLFLRSEDFGYKAYLLLFSFQEYGRDAEKKLFQYVSQKKEVTQAMKVFGRYSILLHIRLKSEQELQHFIIELRNRYASLGSYEIIPVFSDIAINTFPL